jgi:hypothetical protein
VLGGDLGFHKDEFLDQGKTATNFSRNVVFFGVSVWINENISANGQNYRHIFPHCAVVCVYFV